MIMAEFEEVKIIQKVLSTPSTNIPRIDLLNNGHIKVGGNGEGGVLSIYRPDKDPITNSLSTTAHLASNGRFTLGGGGSSGKMLLYPGSIMSPTISAGQTIELDGDKGDITLKNADCAEEFDISSSQLTRIEPGTVMVIDNDGRLQISSKSYDKSCRCHLWRW